MFFVISKVTTFHFFNFFFTFFGDTHYFRKNTNIFSGIEKHNFSYWCIETAYNSKAFILKFRNNPVKVSNARSTLFRNTEFCQSDLSIVLLITYLVTSLMPGQKSACPGQ